MSYSYTTMLSPREFVLGNVIIWAYHGGTSRTIKYADEPHVTLNDGAGQLCLTLADKPEAFGKSGCIFMPDFKTAIEFVSRNHDILLQHYNDVDDTFTDIDLFTTLKKRGEYR